MDIYLAAATEALTHRPGTSNDPASAPNENAYYARHAWAPSVPAWVNQLLTLVRTTHRAAPGRAPLARHA